MVRTVEGDIKKKIESTDAELKAKNILRDEMKKVYATWRLKMADTYNHKDFTLPLKPPLDYDYGSLEIMLEATFNPCNKI